MWNKVLAHASSESLAISGPKHSYSYVEVIDRAQKAAFRIQEMGLDQQCIGIALREKEDEIVCCLAVLLSGNYFFFLPHQIQDDFLAHVPVDLLVTDLSQFATLPCEKIQWDELNAKAESLYRWWDQDISKRWFCVFATSGSTGIAKYVVHDYQSIQEDTSRQIEENEITSADRISLLFALSFSSSLAGIFPAFCSGAGLVVQDLIESGLAGIPAFWERNQITFTSLTSSAFRSVCKLAGADLKSATQSIRFLCLGGEPVIASDISLIADHFPAEVVLQLAYASTEARTVSSLKLRPAFGELASHDGFPVRNKTVRILSDAGASCRMDEVGEVVVFSPFISVGYLRDKILLPHPVEEDQRIYRTGDRARWRSGGSLQLLGRIQSLQKVNGKLIDLSDLEAAIAAMVPASRCKVLASRDASGLEYLVAFIESPEVWEEVDLRRRVSQESRFSTVPRIYLGLEQFPLNVNGKVDRKALLNLAESKVVDFANGQIEDPVTALIHRVWCEELGLPITGLDADFFTELGGSSLLAEITIDEISRKTGKKLESHLLHDFRTIRNLAQHLNLPDVDNLPAFEIWSEKVNPEFGWVLFIEPGFYNSFTEIKEPLLTAGDFNVACLRIDLYRVLDAQDVEELIASWGKMAEHLYGNVIWVGASFNGWLAAKMSEKYGGSVVMLDSPSYHTRSKSIVAVKSGSRLKYLFEMVRENPSPMVLGSAFRLVRNFTIRKLGLSGTAPSLFIRSVRVFIDRGAPVRQVNDLLYVYSEKSLMTSKQDPSNWKSLTKGCFRQIEIEGDHLDAASSQYGQMVALEIAKFCKKIGNQKSDKQSVLKKEVFY